MSILTGILMRHYRCVLTNVLGLGLLTACMTGPSAFAPDSLEAVGAAEQTVPQPHTSRTLVFEDEFDREETQNLTDEVGNGWEVYQSPTGLPGIRSTDLREGHLYVDKHEDAPRGVALSHPILVADGAFEVRFKLRDNRGRLALSAADLQEKTVHAGHIIGSKYGPKGIDLLEQKTMIKNLEVMKRQKAGLLTDAEQAAWDSSVLTFDHPVDPGVWHTIYYEFSGETLRVFLNGEFVGQLTSPGVAHETKRIIRIGTTHSSAIDYVRVYRLDDV